MTYLLFLSGFIFCSLDRIQQAFEDHAIYLSVVEVEFDPLSDRASIKIKVFTDDMEDALTNKFGAQISLSTENECTLEKRKIEEYFSHYFKLAINDGKSVKLALDHCELLTDAIWFQFYAPGIDPPDKISISAVFLMELFPTQSNVISITLDGKKQFANLTKADPTVIFKF